MTAGEVHAHSSRLLVSVIIPAYNAAGFIRETVESALTQTWKELEIIVVNDGSTDDTSLVIKALQQNDTRIHLIEKSNSGVSHTRNVGIEAAKGRYFAFLDADDTWLPENLAEKMDLLQQTNADAVYSPCHIMDENGRLTGETLSGSHEPTLMDLLLLSGNYLTAPSALLVDRKVINAIGGFDPQLSNNADQDLWLRLLSAGYRIVRTPNVLWNYRVHGSNMSGNIRLLEKDSLYLYEKLRKNGVFPSTSIRKKSTALIYRMLAGSWWKQGNNKLRAIYFLLLYVLTCPSLAFKRRKV